MRINKTQKNLKKPVIISAISAAVIGCIFAYAWFSPNISFIGVKPDAPENTVDTKPATDQQKTAGDAAKQAFIDEKYGEGSNDPSKPGPVGNVAVNITSMGQSDGFLQVRAIIDSTSAEGQCGLKISNSTGKVIEYTSTVQSMGSYSVCQGFDVAESELSSGEWAIEVAYLLNGSTQGKTSKNFKVVR